MDTSQEKKEDFEFYEDEFVQYLKNKKNKERSIHAILTRLNTFFKNYEVLNKENFSEYYENILDAKKATTVNGYVLAINVYISFLEEKFKVELQDWKNKTVKIKKVQFLEDILSMEEYDLFINKAKARNKDKIFIACKIMATTGMRVHEILNIRRKHIEWGFIDFVGKGGKERRVYFTTQVQKEVLEILDKHQIEREGYIICSYWNGKQQTWKDLRSLQHAITNFAEKECELKKGLVHPHMFRHFFAKNFIKKYQNIALLADLLGHSNLDTTRIYLKYTSREQQEVVNEVVTW